MKVLNEIIDYLFSKGIISQVDLEIFEAMGYYNKNKKDIYDDGYDYYNDEKIRGPYARQFILFRKMDFVVFVWYVQREEQSFADTWAVDLARIIESKIE